MRGPVVTSVDTYIKSFPADIQELLQAMRSAIQKAAPKATEAMKYGIPTFVQGGNLVHYAAFKKHIGFYPTPDIIIAFKKDLEKYTQSKGAVQFPIDEKLPLGLVGKMVKERIKRI